MTSLPFHTLSPVPAGLTATNVLARMIDGLGFRYHWATEGLREEDLAFRPVDSSMSIQEVMLHVYDLAYGTHRKFGGEAEKDRRPEQVRERTLALYAGLRQQLEDMDDVVLAERIANDETWSIWFWINGPIADALTHVGQITSWRRMAGNPQPAGVDVFRGVRQ